MAPKRRSNKSAGKRGKKSAGKGRYRFTHLTKVNIRNVFVHSLKIQ